MKKRPLGRTGRVITIILVSNDNMKSRSRSLLWLSVALVGCPAWPQESATQDEKDSYEIYSLLLRTEVGPEWKITSWVIAPETRTFPGVPSRSGPDVRQCLNVAKDQAAVYSPVIEDYITRNEKNRVLERKFDLPQYTVAAIDAAKATREGQVLFEVSAVGFSADRTRALVYVGHRCGSLCGGGTYHLLVKKDGKWQVDRDYRGISCGWVS